MPPILRSRVASLRAFLDGQSASGLILIAAALVAIALANSPLRYGYDALLHRPIGPLSLIHWINDGAMALFFLLVGLEIKREALQGELSSWSRRILPGIAAIGGMVLPACLYLSLNRGATAAGWAIPAATDIAFALAVLTLLGNRVPASLRIFLAALAIIDDLGAVVIIALFYTQTLALADLAMAGVALALLVGLNRLGVRRLSPYLLLGLILWVFVLQSGVHATIAGVLLAFTIPLEGERGPLHRLEHALHRPVGLLVVPIFGLANAGVVLLALPREAWTAPVTLGVAGGLLLGKMAGVFGLMQIAVRLGLAERPAGASMKQMLGMAMLCGIGFTMSIFITLLAFPGDALLQAEAKLGVLAGSLLSGLLGYIVLQRAAPAHRTA